MSQDYKTQVRAAKAAILSAAVEQAGGNRAKAARALGLAPPNLLRLVRQLGLRLPPPPSRAKLTAAQREEIRQRRAAGASARALAAEYGISRWTIYAVARGER